MSKFDGFADEVRSQSADVRRGCGVHHMLEGLGDRDAASVREVLDDRRVSARAIFDALRKRLGGQTPSIYTIGRHRSRNCNCWRTETKG